MRSEILVPVLFLFFLTVSTVNRVYLYYSTLNIVQSGHIEGLILSHPYEKDGYQNFKLKNINVKVGPFPKYKLGDYVDVLSVKPIDKTVLYRPKVKLISEKNVHVLNVISDYRFRLISIVKRNISEPYSGLILGMTIGYKDDFPSDFLDLLKRTGTIHIIVVSGYNVSIVISSISTIFAMFGRRWNLFLCTVFVLLFAGLAGFDPPVVRASIMGIIAVIGSFYGNYRFPLYILYVTLAFMVLINPAYLSDVGFQLSAVATATVIVGSMVVKGLGTFISTVFITTFVNLAIYPIISYYFGTISLISILSNLLIMWVIPFITFGGFFFFLFPVFLLKLCLIIFIDFYLIWIRFLGNLEFGYIQYKFSIADMFIYYFVLLFGYLLIFKWRSYLNE